MNEFEVKQTKGSIVCNFEEMKEELSNMMTAYTSLEITEDKIPESKKDLAVLRKIRKSVDERKKEVKKSFMQPYEDFEKGVKELLAVIDEPIAMIDGKLKTFDVKRIAEKKEHLASLYSENIEGYSEYIPFEVTLGDKWQNVSFADKDYLYDLSEMKVKIKSDLAAISSLHSEIEQDVISAYKNSGNNLSVAIQKNSDYLSAKEKAEQKVREEQERKAELERQKEQPVEQPVVEKPFVEEPTFTFRVTGIEQITLVKKYLDFAEIKYEEV